MQHHIATTPPFVLGIVCLGWMLGTMSCVSEPQEGAVAVAALEIVPQTTLFSVGERMPLTIRGVSAQGERVTMAQPAQWSTNCPERLGVDSDGVLEGLGVGLCTVAVEANGLSAEAVVEVVREPVTALGLTPETPLVEVGQGVHLTVTATFADDSSRYVTQRVVWTSSDPSIMTVEEGRATGHAPGTAVATALIGDVQGSIEVQVLPAP